MAITLQSGLILVAIHKNTRRVARSETSGSTDSLTGIACRPDTTPVITIAHVVPQALRLTDFVSRPASPNVDPEGFHCIPVSGLRTVLVNAARDGRVGVPREF